MSWLVMIPLARAGAEIEGTVLAGGRTAPESTIPLPSAFETTIEPSGLGAAIVDARVGRSTGAWAQAGLSLWAYAPESEATLLAGGPAIGWTGSSDAVVRFDLAARYDLQAYPNLDASSSGRGEALARGARRWQRWALSGFALGVDRRFAGAGVTDFTTGELGAVLGFHGSGPLAIDVGVSGQVNQAEGVGSDGPVGGQGRSLVRVRLGGDEWHVVLEHRLIVAAEGEIETETQPLFTPLGDYSDDVDALSGGGFVQNRVDLSAAWVHGPWTATASTILRLRDAEPEELQAAYGRAIQGRLEGRRAFSDRLDGFASVGVGSATLAGSEAYTDTSAWIGVTCHLSAKPPEP
jgi:hypothetical protein